MIKFSIITITYNAEKVLKRTTDSVKSQLYTDIEHIIVDGSSTDNTLEIARTYFNESNKNRNGHTIRIMSEPDNGIYDAMNKGLKQATGQYVCFLNAGDYYPNAHTIQDIAAVISEKTDNMLPAVIYGDTDIVDNNGKFISHRRLTPPDNLTWRSFKHGMLVCHQAFYARNDIAQSTPYNLTYHYSADVDWCIRIMKKAEKECLSLINVKKTIVNYTQEGETTRHHKASLKERFKIMAKQYGLITTLTMHAWFVVRAIIKR